MLIKCSISYKNSKLFYSSHHSQKRRKNRNTKIHMHWCAAFWQDFVSWWENKGVEEKMGKSRKKQLHISFLNKIIQVACGYEKKLFFIHLLQLNSKIFSIITVIFTFEKKEKNSNLFLQTVRSRIHVLSIDKNLNKTWSQDIWRLVMSKENK